MQQISNSYKNSLHANIFILVSKNYGWLTPQYHIHYWRLTHIVPCQGYIHSALQTVGFMLQNLLLLIQLNHIRREDWSFHETHILTLFGSKNLNVTFSSSHYYQNIISVVLQREVFLSFTLDNADACLKISNAGSAGSSPLSCGLEAKVGQR